MAYAKESFPISLADTLTFAQPVRKPIKSFHSIQRQRLLDQLATARIIKQERRAILISCGYAVAVALTFILIRF